VGEYSCWLKGVRDLPLNIKRYNDGLIYEKANLENVSSLPLSAM
jgi:hypothetical protein